MMFSSNANCNGGVVSDKVVKSDVSEDACIYFLKIYHPSKIKQSEKTGNRDPTEPESENIQQVSLPFRDNTDAQWSLDSPQAFRLVGSLPCNMCWGDRSSPCTALRYFVPPPMQMPGWHCPCEVTETAEPVTSSMEQNWHIPDAP